MNFSASSKKGLDPHKLQKLIGELDGDYSSLPDLHSLPEKQKMPKKPKKKLKRKKWRGNWIYIALTVFVFFLFVGSASEDRYQTLRENIRKAAPTLNMDILATYTHEAAAIAKKQERPDRVAWINNNYAYLLIKKFGIDSGYIDLMARAESSEDREAVIAAGKVKMREYIYLLEVAERVLALAYTADEDSVYVGRGDPTRTQKIRNNLNYIQMIRGYINE